MNTQNCILRFRLQLNSIQFTPTRPCSIAMPLRSVIVMPDSMVYVISSFKLLLFLCRSNHATPFVRIISLQTVFFGRNPFSGNDISTSNQKPYQLYFSGLQKKHRRLVLRADTSTLDANIDTTATLSADEVNSDEQPTSDR